MEINATGRASAQNEVTPFSSHKTLTNDEVGPMRVETAPINRSPIDKKETSSLEKKTVQFGPRGTAHRKKAMVGTEYTSYTNTIPIFETATADGTHIVISQESSKYGQHNISDIVTSVATKEGIKNEHINGLLLRTKEIIEEQRATKGLNRHGQALARDTENIIDSLNLLFMEKNRDEALQRAIAKMFYSIRENTQLLKKGINVPSTTAFSNVYDSLKDLLITLLESGEFRDVLNDSVDFVRELMRERIRRQKGMPSKFETERFSYTPNVAPPIPPASTLQQTGRVIRTEYEVKNLGQQPFVERIVTRETISTPQASPQATPSTTESFSRYTDYESGSKPFNKDILTTKFISLLKRFGSRDEYKRAVMDVFRIIDALGDYYDKLRSNPKEVLPIETTNSMYVLKESRKIIERFTGVEETKRFRNHFASLFQDVRNDQEMLSFFTQLRSFITTSIDNPQILDNDTKVLEARGLMKYGVRLLHRPIWEDRFRELIEDLRVMFANVRKDVPTTDLFKRTQIFMRDFFLNSNGRPDLFVIEDSIRQFKTFMVPLLREHLKNIPIDRIEMTSPKIDFVLENLTFSAADILPDFLETKIKNEMYMNLQGLDVDQTVHKLQLTMTHIAPVLNRVTFYYHKKTGFKIEDSGIVNVAFKGSGLTVHVHWKLITATGLITRVELASVRTFVGPLYIHFDKAKHILLDRIAIGLMKSTIRKKIARSVADLLQTKITQMDKQINLFFESRPIERLKERADSIFESSFNKVKSTTKSKNEGTTRLKKTLKENLWSVFIPSVEDEETNFPSTIQTMPPAPQTTWVQISPKPSQKQQIYTPPGIPIYTQQQIIRENVSTTPEGKPLFNEPNVTKTVI
jgi:hypothetical protein